MSDFTSDFWANYVIVLTVLSIVACLVMLWLAIRQKVPARADNTTGHVWDVDLTEMNNPLPRWWMWLFVLTIIFAFVYLALYPGLGRFAGTLGWSTQTMYNEEVAEATRAAEPIYARFRAMGPEQLAVDAPAMAVGERLFANNCAQCHGLDAKGGKGFPNLTDNDWLHGGSPEKIRETLIQGRNGNMPAMASAVGTPNDVQNVANYVLSLSGSPHDTLRASLGKAKFAACAACHGVAGKGNMALGAPNLSDDIWLHGWGQEAIVAIINNGKVNQMPAQSALMTDDQIRVLTSYVWGLSNRAGAKP